MRFLLREYIRILQLCLIFLGGLYSTTLLGQSPQWATFIKPGATNFSAEMHENVKKGPDGFLYLYFDFFKYSNVVTGLSVDTIRYIGVSASDPGHLLGLAKIDPDGNHIYWMDVIGSPFGSSYIDNFAIDANNNFILFSKTTDTAMVVTAGAFQPSIQGSSDSHIMMLDATGSNVLYASYFGGTLQGEGKAYNSDILSSLGDIYHTMKVVPTETYPITAGAYQTTNAGTSQIAYIAAFNPNLSLKAGTYFGMEGGGYNQINIRSHVNAPNGDLVITGEYSGSSSLPITPGAVTLGGYSGAFIAVLSANLSTVKYCGTLPGTLSSVVVMPDGRIAAAGKLYGLYNSLSSVSFAPVIPSAEPGNYLVMLDSTLNNLLAENLLGTAFRYVDTDLALTPSGHIACLSNAKSNSLAPVTSDGALTSIPSVSTLVFSIFDDSLRLKYGTYIGTNTNMIGPGDLYSIYIDDCHVYFTGKSDAINSIFTDTAYSDIGTTHTGYWQPLPTQLLSTQYHYLMAMNFPILEGVNTISTPLADFCINGAVDKIDGTEVKLRLPDLRAGFNTFRANDNVDYQWQLSTTGLTGIWNDIPGAIYEDYTPTLSPIAGSRWYRRVASSPKSSFFPGCGNDTLISNIIEIVTNSEVVHRTNIIEDIYGLCPGTPINVNTVLVPSPDGVFGPYNWALVPLDGGASVLSGSLPTPGTIALNGIAQSNFYELKVLDSRNCRSVDTLWVENLHINIAPATVVTCGDSVVIGTSGVAPTWVNYPVNTYAWTPSTGLNNPSFLNPTVVTIPMSGDSMIYHFSVNGCPSDAVKVINRRLLPLPILPSYSLCQGDTVAMGSLITPQAGASYLWIPDDNISNPNIHNPLLIAAYDNQAVNNTTYTLLEYGGGEDCNLTTTQNITVYKKPRSFFIFRREPYAVCPSLVGPSGNLNFGSVPETGIQYSWSAIVNNIGASTGLPTAADALSYLNSTTSSWVVFNLPGPSIPLGGRADGIYKIMYVRTSFNPANSSCIRTDTAFVVYNPTCLDGQGGGSGGDPGSTICDSGYPTVSCGSPYNVIGLMNPSNSYSYHWTPTIGLLDVGTYTSLTAGQSHPAQVIANPPTDTTYTLDIYDESGLPFCTLHFLVHAVSANPVISNIPYLATGCPNSPIQIGSSPTAGYSYLWYPSWGLNSSTVANPIATVSDNTTFFLMVRDSSTGCYTRDTAHVVLQTVFVNAGSDGNYCDGITNTINVGALAAHSNYTYLWTSSSSNVSFANATAAQTTATIPQGSGYITLTLTATNLSNGCTQSDEIEYGPDYSPIFYPNSNPSICPGNSIYIGTNPYPGTNYTYLWSSPSSGNGLTPGEAIKPNPFVTPTGLGPWTYYVTVTEAGFAGGACAVEKTVFVSPVTEPVPSVNPSAPCTPNGVNIGLVNYPPGWAYNWSPLSYVVSAEFNYRTINVYPPVATTYTMSATSSEGCVRTFNFYVPAATYRATMVNQLAVCEGDANPTLPLNTIPIGATVTWTSTTPGATAYLSAININNPVFNIAAAPTGTYTYRASVGYGSSCVSRADITIVVGKKLPNPAGVDLSACIGNCVQIGTNPVYNTYYNWTTFPYDADAMSALSSANIANPIVCPTATATYKLTYVIVPSNCTFTDLITIDVPGAAPTLVVNDLTVCQNPTGNIAIDLNSAITTNTSAATSFWYDPTTTYAPVPTPEAVSSGIYYVKATSASGLCSTIEPVNVSIVSPPSVWGYAVSNCFIGGYLRLNDFLWWDEKVDYSIGNTYTGTATYSTASYIPGSGIVASGLPITSSGTYYTVRVFNSSGCTQDITLFLSPLFQTTNVIGVGVDPTNCYILNNGEITISASGYNLEYSLNGSAYQPSGVFTGLAPGFYSISARDSIFGCSAAGTDIVLNSPICPESCQNGIDDDGDLIVDCLDSECLVTVVANVVNPPCAGQSVQFEATASSNGGNGGFNYLWTGVSGYSASGRYPDLDNVTVLNNGTYNVSVTASTGCTATGSVVVTVNSCPEICENGIDDDNDGNIDAADSDCNCRN